ncbi:type 2 periplasmic-binding domain-containing protein [Cupriavidus sp. PET2-C1]
MSVGAGTTNEAALRRLSENQALEIRVLAQPDLKQAFDLFLAGDVTAFATDEVLLRGFLAHAPDRSRLAFVGEFLTYEPYGIVYRKGGSSTRVRGGTNVHESRCFARDPVDL